MMKRKFTLKSFTLLLVCLLLTIQSSWAQIIGFEILEGRNRSTFSFERVNNLIIVPVMLNNRLPLNFILDTGVRTTILTDRAISDIINISYDRLITISGAGHIKDMNAYLASNITLSLPGIKGHGQSLIVLEEDYLSLGNHLGMNVHGIIGFEFFNHFVVQIDYEHKLITVYDPESFRPRRQFVAMPITVEQARPYIHAEIKLTDGTVLNPKLLIDSGASHGLLLEVDSDKNINYPDEKLQTIIGWGLGGELSGYLGRVNELTIDRFQLKNVLTSFTEDYSDPEILRITGRNGSIGGDLLSRFIVIFDYTGKQLYLKKSRYFSYPFEFNLAGIDIITTGMAFNSFKVVNVIANSPADEAGVKVGDIILSVNGKFSNEWSLTEINNLLRSGPGRRMTLVLNRDNEIIRATYRLRRLI